MAYAALSSLMYTLEQLSKPNQSLAYRSRTQQHVESIHQNLSDLQVFLEDMTKEAKDIETLKFIEKRIRDVVYKAEDKVDSSLRSVILADYTENREGACKFFEEELLKVEEDVDSLKKEVMQIELNKHERRSQELATTPSSPAKSKLEEITIVGMEDVDSLRKEVMQIELNKHGRRSQELATTPSSPAKSKLGEITIVGMEDVDSLRKEVMQIELNKHGSTSATTPSSPDKNTIEENTIVGMEDDFNTILDCLTAQTDELTVIPIFGMGGIGKTTLARKVYDDSYIRSRFDKHAWFTISEEYNQRQMLLEFVSSITTGSNQEMSDDQLMEIVYRGLKGRRFLIVIDDIWSTEAWDQMQRIFPNDDNKSRILLTTRLKYVADYVSCPGFPPHCKSFLSLDDSWNLFTEKLFKKDPCPPHLEKIGKHIVQQCRGLPLSVVVVAGLVGKMDPTHENWRKVEENLNSFFGTVSERCQSILSLSYNYLPQYLRACFLYVGGFPEDEEIEVSKLIRLWIAEQFVKARSSKRLEVVAEEYLQELIDRSLILNGKQRANGRMRTCKIHDLLRQLCLREAHTENVVHVMNGNVPEALYDQRRVILLSDLQEKQVYPTRQSSGITRTFISMQLCLSEGIFSFVSQFKLLKVLDVLSIQYDFSCVIPQLVHLRYVAAIVEEALSLAKLRNLQTLILRTIHRRWLGDPLDIWTMSEIRHVDIQWPLYMSNPLEAKNHIIGEQPLFLNNLQTLNLYNYPFVAEIIRRAPHLKKLKIMCLSENTDFPAIFYSLHLLEELEALHIATVQNIDRMIILLNLKELRLSDIKIPWEVVNLLANLPNLEVLEGYYAFAGTDWKLNEDVVFHKLKYLRIQGGGLQRWEAGSDNFPMLEQLILHELYGLEEIPESIGEIMTLKLIQVHWCGSGVETRAKKIQEEQQSRGNYELQLQITPMPPPRKR